MAFSLPKLKKLVINTQKEAKHPDNNDNNNQTGDGNTRTMVHTLISDNSSFLTSFSHQLSVECRQVSINENLAGLNSICFWSIRKYIGKMYVF